MAQIEVGHQRRARHFGTFRLADDANDFIDVGDCNQQPFKDVRTLFGFAQFKFSAAANHFQAVLDVDLQRPTQGKQAWLFVDQGQQLHAKGRLQHRVLVQPVENFLRLGTTFQFDENAHPVAITFIAQVRDFIELARTDEFGNLFNQARFIHLIWNFSNDDAVAIVDFFNLCHGAHDHAATTGAVGLHNAFCAHNLTASWEVRPSYKAHQLFYGCFAIARVGRNVFAVVVVNHLFFFGFFVSFGT